MTPKEKADELYSKFDYECMMCAYRIDESRAKQCALIAVDEIISFIEDDRDGFSWKKYYQEVKQEINNL